MTMTVIPQLTTDRLWLRSFDMTDASRVHELLDVPDIADTTLNIAYPYPEGAAVSWIMGHEQAAADGTSWTWAITRHQDDLLLGAIGMGVVMAHLRGTLGYWLGVPFWGQGYMSEAARRVAMFGFDDLGVHESKPRFGKGDAARGNGPRGDLPRLHHQERQLGEYRSLRRDPG